MATLQDDLVNDLSGIEKDIGRKAGDIGLKLSKDLLKTLSNEGKKIGAAGVALVISTGKFTVESVMDAVGNITGNNPKFSKQTINIKKLKESGKTEIVDERIAASKMKYFNKYCKKYDIKYSIVRDRSAETKGGEKQYIVFFKSDDAGAVLMALKQGYQDYQNDLNKKNIKEAEKITTEKVKQKELEHDKKNKEHDKALSKKEKQKKESQEVKVVAVKKRDSVTSKLSYYKDEVKKRDAKEKQEKTKKKSELSR